jgi:hypothetical protein
MRRAEWGTFPENTTMKTTEEKLINALREIVQETDGRNSSPIGQDRAFCIAREVLRSLNVNTENETQNP